MVVFGAHMHDAPRCHRSLRASVHKRTPPDADPCKLAVPQSVGPRQDRTSSRGPRQPRRQCCLPALVRQPCGASDCRDSVHLLHRVASSITRAVGQIILDLTHPKIAARLQSSCPCMQRLRHANASLSVHACSDDGKPETRPPLLVTASVDRIALARRLALDADLTMAGSVIWTGRSALDIRMQLRQVYVHPQPHACASSSQGQHAAALGERACSINCSRLSTCR